MPSPLGRLSTFVLVLGLISQGNLASAQTADAPGGPSADAAAGRARARPLGRLAPAFEQNVGQMDDQVRFRAMAQAYGIFLAERESVLTLGRNGAASVRMGFAGAAPLTVRGEGARAGRVFHVSDPSKPASGALRFDRVRYVEAWPGTDIVFHGTDERQVRFDFELAPGADPGRIRLDFTGADDLAIEKNGDLAVTVAGQRAQVRKPVVFQETAAGRRSVEGGFVADGPRAVRFALAGYDHTLPLVIDPTIDFASYLGTGADEEVHWAETSGGSVYVSGRTWSTAFPKVPALTGDDYSSPHCFISKFTPDGSDLAWSVVFDWTGTLAHECGPFALGPDSKVHAALRFFLSGSQWGVSVFTEPAAGGTWVGSNFSVPELQPDRPVRIQADNAGNTYLAGSCNAGAYRDGGVVLPNGERTVAYLNDCSSSSAYGNPATFESMLLKIGPAGERLYGTFIGGTPFRGGTGDLYDRKPDTVRALVVDPVTEEAWVGGQAQSADLPGTWDGGLIDVSLHPPVYPACGQSTTSTECMPNAFVTRIDTTKIGYQSVTYGSYYGIRFASDGMTPISWNGTLADWFSVEDLALEPGGGINLFGNIRRVGQGAAPYDLFVARIVPMGSPQLAFQHVIIGSGFDTAARLARRPNGDLVLGGFTNSPDFPQVGALFPPPTTTLKPYVSVLQTSTGDVLFSSALPGEPPVWPAEPADPPREGMSLAVPDDDVVYAAWTTTADGLGQTVAASGPFQNARGGMKDAVVARFCFNASGCPTDTAPPNTAPTLTATPSLVAAPMWVSAGGYPTLSVVVNDADNDPLTVTWNLPSGMQETTASSGDELYATDLFPLGHSSVTVTVTDPRGGTATATIDVEIVANTPAGPNVVVRPGNDTNPESGGGAVVTIAGTVQATGSTFLAVRNDVNPPPPADRQLGSPPYYYDVWTTAEFSAPPTVCIDVRGHGFADPNAAIYRYGSGTWSPLPTTAVEQTPGFRQLCAPVLLGAAPATLAIMTPEVPANRILTLAGTIPWDPVNDRCLGAAPDPPGGVLATSTRLYYPAGAALAAARNVVYFAEKCGFRVRKLDLGTGTITTMTGTGSPSLGDAASVSTDPAVATFKSPTGVALDPSGNLYVADSGHCRIRKLYLDAAGNPDRIVTIAGTGVCGLSGDGGPATAAQLGSDLYIRTDTGGVLYISDGDRVRRIIPGRPGDGSIDGNPDELITTYAGGGTETPGSTPVPATSLALAKALGPAPSVGGDLYVALLDGILRVDAIGQASLVRQTGRGAYGPVGDSLALLSNGELAWGSSECRGYPDWQCFGRVNRLTKGSDGFVNGSADEIESPLAGYRDWAGLPLTTPPAPPRNSNGDGHGLSARLQSPASLVPLPNGSFVIVDVENGLLRLVGSLTGGTTNTPPYASAGPSYAVYVNETAYLDGSESGDTENDALTYRWTLLSKPPSSVAALIDATAVTAALVPDVPGIYRVQLVVNDGTSDSLPAYAEITVPNRAPVASAGPDQAATLPGPEGLTPVHVVLNGTGSSDPDGQALTYQWTVRDPDGNPHTISGASPGLDLYESGVRSIVLTVSDGTLTSTDSVEIAIVNPKPVADAGPDQAVHFPGAVTLTGSATDANGDTIAGWSWFVLSSPAGATATLSTDQAQSTAFFADKPGRYEIQLAARDGWGWSAPDSVVVELTDAPPVAAPDVATSLAGNAVVIDVLANDSDADGDPFTLTTTGTPGRGTLTPLDTSGARPGQFVYRPTNPAAAGTDTFTYTIATVLPGGTLSSSVTGTVTVNLLPNRLPTAVADAASVTVGGEIAIPVLGNDQDADGDPVRLVNVTGGTLGTAVVGGFEVYYRSSGTGGVDTLTYTIEDLDPYDSRVKSTSTGTIRVTVQNSPVGSSVQVPLTTSAGGPTPVTVTFSYVTAAGQTVANPITPPSVPSDTFQIAGVTYDISTTAAFTPPVLVCFAGTFGENDYLLHYVGGFWEVLPNQQHLDPKLTSPPTYGQVCATTNSLSPFVIATKRSQTFTFTGFFNPVDNPPSVNAIKGGRAVPVKFSLGGDYGLSIFEAGYPRVERVACDTGAPTEDVEETVTAGSSGLQYDATAGIYTYVWKTTTSMAGGCWRLSLRLTDGTQRYALFSVKK